jgi:hypothetical protein
MPEALPFLEDMKELAVMPVDSFYKIIAPLQAIDEFNLISLSAAVVETVTIARQEITKLTTAFVLNSFQIKDYVNGVINSFNLISTEKDSLVNTFKSLFMESLPWMEQLATEAIGIGSRIFDVINNIAKDFSLIYDNLRKSGLTIGSAFIDAFASTFTSNKDRIAGLIDESFNLYEKFKPQIEKLTSGVTSSIRNFVDVFTKEFYRISGIDLWSAVKEPFETFKNNLISLFYDLYIYLVGNSIWPDTIDGIVEEPKNLWNRVSGFFTSFYDNIKKVFQDISQVITSLFNENTFEEFYDKLIEFKNNYGRILLTISSITSAFLSVKLFNVNPIYAAFSSLVAITTLFRTELLALGKDAYSFISGNVFSKATVIYDFSTDLIKRVTSYYIASRELGYSVTRSLLGSIKFFAIEMQKGIQKLFTYVKDGISDTYDNLVGKMTGLWENNEDILNSIKDNFVKGIGLVFNAISSAVNFGSNVIFSAVRGIGAGITSIMETISAILLKTYDEQFSKGVFIGLTAVAAALSTTIRSFVFSRLKGILITAILPVINNTFTMKVVALWSQGLIGLIYETITGEAARQFGPDINNVLASRIFDQGTPNETTLQLYTRSVSNLFNAIGLGLAGAIANTFRDRFEREISATYGSISPILKEALVNKSMADFAEKYARPLGAVLAVGLAAAFVPAIRKGITKALALAFGQADLFAAFKKARSSLGSTSFLNNALMRTIGSLFLGINIGSIISDMLELDANSLESYAVVTASTFGAQIGTRFLFGFIDSLARRSGNAALSPLAQRILFGFRSSFLALLAGSFVFSDVGDLIISSIFDRFGGLAYYRENEALINVGLVGALALGKGLISGVLSFSRQNPLGAIIGLSAIANLAGILSDGSLIRTSLESSGFGDVLSENLIAGIESGLIARQAGLNAKMAGAIALAVGMGSAALEGMEGEGGKGAEVLNSAITGAAIGSLAGPWGAAGGAIAGAIYGGLDSEWQAKINSWVVTAAENFGKLFEAQTWIDVGNFMLQGWDSLNNTIDSIVNRIIDAKNALLEFLGINKESYTAPDQVSNRVEYKDTRTTVQKRINDSMQELADLQEALKIYRVGSPERQNLMDQKVVVEAELKKLREDATALVFGPAGRFIAELAGEQETNARILESTNFKATMTALEDKEVLLDKLDPIIDSLDSKLVNIDKLFETLSQWDPNRIEAIGEGINKLEELRYDLMLSRDTKATQGGTITTPAGTKYVGTAAQDDAMIRELDTQIQEGVNKLLTIKNSSDSVVATSAALETAIDEFQYAQEDYILKSTQTNQLLVSGISTTSQAYLDSSQKTKEAANYLQEASLAMTLAGIQAKNILDLLNGVNRQLPPAIGPSGVPMATGGFVSGPGTGTSDSIPAMLSNGEYVINANSTKKFLPLLQKINSGSYRSFKTGGLNSDAAVTMDGPIYGSTELGKQKVLEVNVKSIDVTLPKGYEFDTGLDPSSTYQSTLFAGIGGEGMVESGALALLQLEGAIKEVEDSSNKSTTATENLGTASKGATQELSDLEKKLKEIGEQAIEMTTMTPAYFAQAGLDGASVMLQSFKDNLSGYAKGELSFAEMRDGLLDSFTNKMIDNFIDSMTNSLFNKFDLTGIFGGLFSGASSAGAAMGGGVLAPNASGLMQGGTPVFVTNMPMAGGLGGTVAPTGTPSAAGGGGFFQSIFSEISGFFSKLFGGIGNIFSSLLGGLGGLFGGGGGFFNMIFAAEGGKVTGPGTGTSDSIMAMLSNGEYVVNAATTKRWLPFLETLNANDGRIPAFSSGGQVGPANSTAFTMSKENNNKDKQQQVFNINVTGDVSMQARKEIARMIPEITAGVNMTNRERGSR